MPDCSSRLSRPPYPPAILALGLSWAAVSVRVNRLSPVGQTSWPDTTPIVYIRTVPPTYGGWCPGRRLTRSQAQFGPGHHTCG